MNGSCFMFQTNTAICDDALIILLANLIAGVYKAFDYGSACIQFPDNPNTTLPLWSIGDVSEDCLYLNLWVPRPRKQNRAVMVCQ